MSSASKPQDAATASATSVATEPTANATVIAANRYHLSGGGITISYFPDGFGPPTIPGGGALFTYQDAVRSLKFTGSQIRTVELPDLGAVISVTLVETVDVGSTTFSLLLPHVTLRGPIPASALIRTLGITTVHHILAGMIGHTQAEDYTVTKLRGAAQGGILPQ